MNISSLKQWWQQLNLREQRLVTALGSATVIFLFYGIVWKPLNDSLAIAEKKLESRQALLTWVNENTAQYNSAKANSNTTASSGSLSSIINRTANRQQLTITRMQTQGDNLQVWLDSAPFTQLLFWLEHLANKEGLQVQAIDLSKSDKPGEVKVRRLQLSRQ